MTKTTKDGMIVTYSPKTDGRVRTASSGQVVARSAKAAREIAGELRAWGITSHVDGNTVLV